MKRFLCFIFISSIGIACTNDADDVSRTKNVSTSKAEAQDEKESAASSKSTSSTKEIENDSVDGVVNAAAEDAAQRIVSINQEVFSSKSGEDASKELDFDQQVQEALLKSFMDQQKQDPSKMSEEQAAAIASKLYDVMKVSKKNNTLQTSKAIAEFTKLLSETQSQNASGLALYDNSTIMGRILNAGNGVIDLVVELYAAVLNFDIQAVTRVASSAARVVFQLFEV